MKTSAQTVGTLAEVLIRTLTANDWPVVADWVPAGLVYSVAGPVAAKARKRK